jgi:hypothetical protein
MPIPTNKAVKDLFDGLLGREVTVANGTAVDPTASLGPSTAVYVDDRGELSAVVLMDFALTAYVGAALGLIPAGGAQAAIEDRQLGATLNENAYELLNVLAGVLNHCSEEHQRLYTVHRPGEVVPADVAPWMIAPGPRTDLALDIKGYGGGGLSIDSALGA